MAKKKSAAKSGGIKDLIKDDEKFMVMSDIPLDVPKISCGIDSVDNELLGGGFPKGRIVLASGPEGSNKTALALRFAAEAQKHGYVVYIDLEGGLDPRKAENSGVDMDELILVQSDSAEEILEKIKMCYEAGDVSAVILDSISTLQPEAEVEGDFSDQHMAVLARLLSKALRDFVKYGQNGESDMILFLVSQVRSKIGGMGHGPQTDTTGGRGPKFYASTWLEFVRKGALKQGEDIIGQETQVHARKARFSRPFQKITFELYYDSGVSNEAYIIDQACLTGHLKKSGAWYKDGITDESLAQGKPKLIEYLRENDEYYQELRSKVLDIR